MRLLHDWIWVELDKDEETMANGLLYKPEQAYEHILRTGKVIQVGPGRRIGNTEYRKPTELSPGDGVVFIRFLADGTSTGRSIQEITGKDRALIRVDDVLVAYDRTDPPRFGQ